MTGPLAPPVLLVHGFASSFDHTWRQAGWADLLADAGREVIGPDLRGHGTAPRPLDPAAYDDVEGDVAAAIGEHTVDGVGFSLGAHVVLTLAARDPARFRRVVVIGAGANLLRDGKDPEALAASLEAGAGADDVLAQLFARLAESAGNDRRALAAFLRRRRPPLTPEALARVTCPVLVVIGDRDFAAPAEPLVEALPDARLVTVRGADHFSAPRDFRCIDAALAFLDAVP